VIEAKRERPPLTQLGVLHRPVVEDLHVRSEAPVIAKRNRIQHCIMAALNKADLGADRHQIIMSVDRYVVVVDRDCRSLRGDIFGQILCDQSDPSHAACRRIDEGLAMETHRRLKTVGSRNAEC